MRREVGGRRCGLCGGDGGRLPMWLVSMLQRAGGDDIGFSNRSCFVPRIPAKNIKGTKAEDYGEIWPDYGDNTGRPEMCMYIKTPRCVAQNCIGK